MVTVVGEDTSAYKQITCKHCAAVLQYLPYEVKEYHGKDYSGGPAGREYITCPRCASDVVIRSW